MNRIMDQIAELHQSYNDLGEDMIFLESVALALRSGYEFPEEYVTSGLKRLMDYIDQHAGEVQKSSQILCKVAIQPPHPQRSS